MFSDNLNGQLVDQYNYSTSCIVYSLSLSLPNDFLCVVILSSLCSRVIGPDTVGSGFFFLLKVRIHLRPEHPGQVKRKHAKITKF